MFRQVSEAFAEEKLKAIFDQEQWVMMAAAAQAVGTEVSTSKHFRG